MYPDGAETAMLAACKNTARRPGAQLVPCQVSEGLKEQLKRHGSCPRMVSSGHDVEES